MTRAILQRVPEYIHDVDYPTLCAWQNAGLIYPVAKNEQGLEVYAIDDISKRRGEIEAKYDAILERQNLEQRARSIATELEAATVRARQSGNHDLILRAQILARQKKELDAKLAPVVKAPDIADLKTELEAVKQQHAKATERAKRTINRDDILQVQRAERRIRELQALINNAQ